MTDDQDKPERGGELARAGARISGAAAAPPVLVSRETPLLRLVFGSSEGGYLAPGSVRVEVLRDAGGVVFNEPEGGLQHLV